MSERERILVFLGIVAWFELGVVLVTVLPGCGKDKRQPAQTFVASPQLHDAEVKCGVTAYEEPTINQVPAVRCEGVDYVCCLPYARSDSSWYHPTTNTIDLVIDTQPPQCAEYIVEHNLPCEMESAATYQATGVYVDRCVTPC